MTVQELIDFLSEQPRDLELGLLVEDSGGYEAIFEKVDIKDLIIKEDKFFNVNYLSIK